MESKSYNISFNTNYLEHVGNKNSGRYPRGSGEHPYQHDKSKHGSLKAGLIGAGISAVGSAAHYPMTRDLVGNSLLSMNDSRIAMGYDRLIDIPSFMRNFKIGYVIGGGLGALTVAAVAAGLNYGSKKLFNSMINNKLKKVKIKDVDGFKQRLQSDTANRRALLSSLGLAGLGINAIADDVRLSKELKNYNKINQKTGKIKNKYKPHN